MDEEKMGGGGYVAGVDDKLGVFTFRVLGLVGLECSTTS